MQVLARCTRAEARPVVLRTSTIKVSHCTKPGIMLWVPWAADSLLSAIHTATDLDSSTMLLLAGVCQEGHPAVPHMQSRVGGGN